MSDYRDYEIRVAYDGGIYVSAIDEEEALKIAREIIGEEMGQDIAESMTYRATWAGANKESYKCDVCGSNYWRYLHEGDESNCECEGGECWRVCNEWNDGEGCDGVAELVETEQTL